MYVATGNMLYDVGIPSYVYVVVVIISVEFLRYNEHSSTVLRSKGSTGTYVKIRT